MVCPHGKLRHELTILSSVGSGLIHMYYTTVYKRANTNNCKIVFQDCEPKNNKSLDIIQAKKITLPSTPLNTQNSHVTEMHFKMHINN